MSQIIDQIEREQMKQDLPSFAPGDTVVVQVRVTEGDRERLQAYEGVVIAKRNRGLNSSFTVRKISHGEGVERVFPLHSPRLEKVEVVRKGSVRRAKLGYLRDRSGKAARVKAMGRGATIQADGTEVALDPAELQAAAEAEVATPESEQPKS